MPSTLLQQRTGRDCSVGVVGLLHGRRRWRWSLAAQASRCRRRARRRTTASSPGRRRSPTGRRIEANDRRASTPSSTTSPTPTWFTRSRRHVARLRQGRHAAHPLRAAQHAFFNDTRPRSTTRQRSAIAFDRTVELFRLDPARSARRLTLSLAAERGDRVGHGQRALRVGDVEVLDHPAVDGDDAAARRPGPRRTRRSPGGRARPRRRSGAHTSLAMSTWPGWISVLPSKPISTPCTHSARKPSRSFTSLYTPSRIALPASRAAASAVARWGSSGCRPAHRARRAARGRGRWCPSPAPTTRGWAAMARTSKIAVGVSIIAQIVIVAGAPAASSSADTWSRYADRADLRDHDGRGADWRRGGDVVGAPRRVEAVAADGQLAAAVLARRRGGDGVRARRRPWRRGRRRPRGRR